MNTGESSQPSLSWPAGKQYLSPAARLFHSPRFNCYIISILGCKTNINPDVVKAGLKQTLLKHPRFSSKLVSSERGCGKRKWTRTSVNLEDHVIVPNFDSEIDSPDRFVEDYISNITTTPLDFSKPLWELHLLNVKTSYAEAVGVFRIHHSVGDGASLMSLLLACTRKTSDPDSLPTVPTMKKRTRSSDSSWFWRFLWVIWSVLIVIWNTFVHIVLFLATTLFLKDTKTPIKGELGVELATKRFVHRTVSLDHIKLIKNSMKLTVNDVIVGVTQASLSKYLNRRYAQNQKDGGSNHKRNNLPKSIRLRAAILINLRPTVGIQDLAEMMAKDSKTRWGNWIGYILVPFTIALQDDPLNYILQAKAMIDRKKLSLEAICTFATAKLIITTFGAKVAGFIAHRLLSNTTMAFSSLVGPLEDVSFYGHPITFIAPSVYGHPHALTIHFQSYVNKMTIALAVDPSVIPDPHQLLDEIEESLKLTRDAVVKRELTQEPV
ncbi:wax ester synthase/diacylglycerol acyltransferase 6-like isoform X2 [Ziziphus jujuba]|uniref:Wax ester synthase/diacylglycerol acyltransferase 6-like isoform X2 n=1 Tax=Ziziphus jujuba TaxID=326968 RepID=A0A6P3ZSM0_ZIZJJ|nr:wax ester synthase/diacylglycerol acyltransferase 6-like isoform X2 [Ziziphus jujuba]